MAANSIHQYFNCWRQSSLLKLLFCYVELLCCLICSFFDDGRAICLIKFMFCLKAFHDVSGVNMPCWKCVEQRQCKCVSICWRRKLTNTNTITIRLPMNYDSLLYLWYRKNTYTNINKIVVYIWIRICVCISVLK